MRIAIDASCTLPPKTGIGYYVHHLCRELAIRAPRHEFRLLLNSFRHGPPDEELIRPANVTARRHRIPGPWLMRSWRYLNAPPLEALVGRFDLFHGMASIVPPRLGGRC